MINCPYCNKEFKKANFWFENHLMLKHRYFKFYIKTFLIDLVIIGIIPSLIFFIISQDSQDNLSKKLDTIIEKYNISTSEECISNVTSYTFTNNGINLKAELYDGCDIKLLEFNNSVANYGSYSLLIYPFWYGNDNKKHYFLDVFQNNSQKNRISLFKGDGSYLTFEIYSSTGKSYATSINVNNWKEKEWGQVIYSFDGTKGEIVLGFKNLKTDYNEVNSIKVEPFNFSLEFVNQYVGSDIYGLNQAYAVLSKIPRCWIFLDEVDENCPTNFLENLR